MQTVSRPNLVKVLPVKLLPNVNFGSNGDTRFVTSQVSPMECGGEKIREAPSGTRLICSLYLWWSLQVRCSNSRIFLRAKMLVGLWRMLSRALSLHRGLRRGQERRRPLGFPRISVSLLCLFLWVGFVFFSKRLRHCDFFYLFLLLCFVYVIFFSFFGVLVVMNYLSKFDKLNNYMRFIFTRLLGRLVYRWWYYRNILPSKDSIALFYNSVIAIAFITSALLWWQ